MPQQELTQVHRQAAGSPIPAFAQEIRCGRVPQFDAFAGPAQGVSFLDVDRQHLSRTVTAVRQALAGCREVQILGVTRRGEAGVETINAAIHELIAGRQRTLPGWGFAETEPVMHGENDYERELFNGSLGRIHPVVSEHSEARTVHALECDFGGVVHRFDEDSLDRLEIAHAITVHKARGSQFQRVIIPVLPSLLLDRTLVYTALTRAVDQVVFIGDRNALSNAIVAAPRSQMRQVGFRF